MASMRSDRAGGIEQVGLAGAGPAAADVDRDDGRLVEHDRRHAGGEPGIIGMADPDAGDVGQEIARAWRHGGAPRFRCGSAGPR